MAKPEMVAVAWNNGSHHQSGAGYGLEISVADRDAHLDRSWQSLNPYLSGQAQPVAVNIDKNSFWNDTCRELINRQIGAWLIRNGMAPWPNGEPPRFVLVSRCDRAFDVFPARIADQEVARNLAAGLIAS